MRRSLMKRVLAGICCAFLFSGISVAITEAFSPDDTGPAQTGPVRSDCNECHGSVVDNWNTSAHGQALTDEIFQEAWAAKGEPKECLTCHTTGYDAESGTWISDGVSCLACHGGQTGPHPETAMPTDSSSRLCGTCHLDTFAEWQTSAHGEGEMACVRCHNPHTTNLRAGNMADLCSTCHTEESYFYGTTAHSQKGLGCTDCHLRISEGAIGEGHGQREHTFAVDLETCNQCHSEEMHLLDVQTEADNPEVTIINNPLAGDQSCEMGEPIVSTEPEESAVSPLNYLLVAAVGLTFGIAIAPVAENWYGRIANRNEEEK